VEPPETSRRMNLGEPRKRREEAPDSSAETVFVTHTLADEAPDRFAVSSRACSLSASRWLEPDSLTTRRPALPERVACDAPDRFRSASLNRTDPTIPPAPDAKTSTVLSGEVTEQVHLSRSTNLDIGQGRGRHVRVESGVLDSGSGLQPQMQGATRDARVE
jgi:hypothetical protein